jgi:hypothetical protein
MAFLDSAAPSGASESSGSTASSASAAVCSVIDVNPEFKDYGVSYVSASKSIALRESNSLIENHIVIAPAAGEDKPTNHDLRDRLIDLGVDCFVATPLSYFATVSTCGGTVVTMGAAAPLCVMSAVGAGASSLKCGHAIGKMINHVTNPGLNQELDQNQYWKYYETAVDGIDILSNVPGAVQGVKNIGALTKFSSKYGKGVAQRFTKAESKKIYKELAEALGESFSNSGTRQWVNRQGLSLRYSPAVVNSMLEKQLVDTGIATVNLYDNTADINKRHNLSDAYPQRTVVKDSLRSFSDAATRDTQRPTHTVYFLQQAKP